jgi:hypothetical protein
VALDDQLGGVLELQPSIRPEASEIINYLKGKGTATYYTGKVVGLGNTMLPLLKHGEDNEAQHSSTQQHFVTSNSKGIIESGKD